MARPTKADWWKLLHCAAFGAGGTALILFSPVFLFVKLMSVLEDWAERKELLARFRIKEPTHDEG